jgi:hypothetical protein
MTDIQRVGYDHSMHHRGMDKAADRFVQDKEERHLQDQRKTTTARADVVFLISIHRKDRPLRGW